MRRALLVVAAVTVIATAIPTASLTATQADRNVAGSAVGDSEAYVGVDMRVERPDPAPATSTGTDGAAGENETNATATPVSTDDSSMELLVTVRNRLPNVGGFTAIVSVEDTLGGDVQTVSDHVIVDDEATASLSPVSCDDTVRVLVRTDDVSVELTRPVPCEN